LALEPSSPAAFDFLVRVALSYAGLLETPLAHPETGLGGNLFYAGDLDDEGRTLVVAANISGAATLVAAADSAAQKQAIRDGVADFVVTTLDEALRVLKNQLRKRETVAVCVALPPSEVDREMNERGVAPDLLRRELRIPPLHEALLLRQNAEALIVAEDDPTGPYPSRTPALVTWRVDSALPKDLAKLDEIALTCLDPEEWKSRRWLRLSPRYLGRLAQGLRLLDADLEFAARFIEQVKQCVGSSEIAVAVEICSYFRGQRDEFRFAPTKP
jgi:urocanase-like protein